MRPEDIGDILPGAEPVDPALLERIAAAVRRDLRPVRPVAAPGTMVAGLLAIFCVVALGAASKLGFIGFSRLSGGAIGLIFPALGGLALLAAAASVSAMIPGSRRPWDPAVLLAAGSGLMAAIFVILFHNYSAGRFVPEGIVCLEVGLLCAIPAGAGAWLVLRRGYAVDGRAAALAAGTFAGLAGLAVLELHCPNFRFWHIAVWHLAVVPVSALAACAIYFLGSKRKAAELMQ